MINISGKETLISASIVLYNSNITQLKTVIQSYAPDKNRLLYLIDNSSNDRFRFLEKQFSNTRYIHSENVGYGAAHNIALQEALDAGSNFHLILNPDIQFISDIIPVLLSYMQNNEDVSYILPKVIYPDGTCQYLCKLLPTPLNLIFRRFMPKTGLFKKADDRYILRNSGYNKILNPPCLSGCFMFLRMSIIRKYKLFFDERFFMYCEDVDFIRRLHRVGKTIYLPDVSIIHDHAKESYKSKRMLWEHIKSAIKYFNKWGWVFDAERKRMNKQILHEIVSFNKLPPNNC
jgi:GT2 family glycosyltransferase